MRESKERLQNYRHFLRGVLASTDHEVSQRQVGPIHLPISFHTTLNDHSPSSSHSIHMCRPIRVYNCLYYIWLCSEVPWQRMCLRMPYRPRSTARPCWHAAGAAPSGVTADSEEARRRRSRQRRCGGPASTWPATCGGRPHGRANRRGA